MSASVTATFCATLVDEWVRAGVRHAVIAPGSRSTPLALALAARDELSIHLFHDERSASFAALGIALSTGVPAVLLCTSGTAATHFHAAVVEAHQSDVPMIVCTADRPPELREVGAPQTIDQNRLYGPAVRWFADPGVPDAAMAGSWRSLAARSVLDSMGPRPGPVHLNLPFREPLVGEPGDLPPPRDGGWHRSATRVGLVDLDPLADVLSTVRGVIVAGAGAGDPDAVHTLADATGWPVLADPRSGCRVPRDTTVGSADALVRHAGFAADHRPDVVIRLGEPPASKVLNQWLAASGATQVAVHGTARWLDAAHDAHWRIVADPSAWCRAAAERAGGARTPWAARWAHAERTAQRVLDSSLPDGSEPWIARTVTRSMRSGSTLVVSSSMPVRDVEWYGVARDDVRVMSNRGTNGIDGVLSTAIGVALTGAPTVLYIGDVALLHDSTALVGLTRRGIDLAIVVVDNDGGGIFEFLPQATSVPRDRFELLFGTPHGVDLSALAVVHGIEVCALTDALDRSAGVRMAHLRTDRRANVAVHDAVHRSVIAALDHRP